MKILKLQLRQKAKKLLEKEEHEFNELCSTVEDEYTKLWEKTDNLILIRKLLLSLGVIFLKSYKKSKDSSTSEYTEFRELITELLYGRDAMLQPTREREISIIEKYRVDKYFKRLKPLISRINALMDKYNSEWEGKYGEGAKIFTRLYDGFSEASRNNSLKVSILMDIINRDKTKKLLEIGFGTGPLLRRLWGFGCNVTGIDSNLEGLSMEIRESNEAKNKIIIADYMEKRDLQNRFDVIFIEAGVLIFTILDDGNLVCEAYFGMDYMEIREFLEKVYSDLEENGIFLIGTQKILHNIDMGESYIFSMRRKQFDRNAMRELFFYKNKKLIFYNRQRKRTMSYQEFCAMAYGIGFKKIYVSSQKQWVVLEK